MLALPKSYQSTKELKQFLRNRHAGQNSETNSVKSVSFKIDVLRCHLPGPGGMASGIEVQKIKALWSEKGQG